MSSQVKLGIFDSGIGGLSAANSLIDRYPHIETWYLADSLYLPYGTKKKQVVRSRVSKMMRFFHAAKFSHVVCACNTAYALAGDIIEQYKHDLHLANVTQALIHSLPTQIDINKSLLIATPNTIKSGVYQNYLQQLYGKDEIHLIANSRLVELIETNADSSSSIYNEVLDVAKNCQFVPKNIILGCTHYNWVEKEFRKVFPGADVYGSSKAFIFSEFDQEVNKSPKSRHFLETGHSANLKRLVWMQHKKNVEQLSLEDPVYS